MEEVTNKLMGEDREAYEKWAFTPYDGLLWNFKEATWKCWQAALDYARNKHLEKTVPLYRSQCTCPCHVDNRIMHFVDCCEPDPPKHSSDSRCKHGFFICLTCDQAAKTSVVKDD